ncbi:MAG: hypothetical protein JO356_10800 [Acidobacteria bacterium]|nr:hypothetical protein [Acidobacteriota bacterium]
MHSFAINFLLRLALFPTCVFLLLRYLCRVQKLARWSKLSETVLVVIAAAVFTVRLTAPLAYHIIDQVPWSLVDGYFIAYVQAWDVHALDSQPLALFDANLLFPTKQALALSENHLGNMPIFAPIYALTGNSILASNVVMMATFFLSAIAMYLLVRWWLGNRWAAAVAGFVYGFAPARVYQMPRVHIINLQFIPLIVLFLLRFLRSGRRGNLVTFSALIFLQALCSMHGGVFAVIVVVAFLVAELIEERNFWTRRALAVLGSMVTVGAILLPLLLPYLKWEKQGVLNTLNSPPEVFSATPSSYLNGDSELYPGLLKRFRSPLGDYEKKLFFGFLPLGMSCVGVAGYLAKKRAIRSQVLGATTPAEASKAGDLRAVLALGALISIVFGFVLSLGPYLHVGSVVINLPYHWLSRFLPGFHAVRSACRFGFIVLFGVAILAGLGYEKMLKLVGHFRPFDSTSIFAALTVALLFVVYWEFFVDLHTVSVPIQPAPEYRFLSSQPPGAVTLELPTFSYTNLPTAIQSDVTPIEFDREAAYVYASSFHWQPIMNGLSGHVSPVSTEISSLAVQLPAPKALYALAHYGLRFVIVHTNAVPAEQREAWHSLQATSAVTKIASFPDAEVYQLRDLSKRLQDLRGMGVNSMPKNMNRVGE